MTIMRGVRNVHADFDHRGGDENLDFVAAKLFHHGIFFVVFQAAVQQADTQIREDVFREALEFGRGGFQFLLRFFDDGIDDVSLTPGGDFAAHEFPHAQELFFFASSGFRWACGPAAFRQSRKFPGRRRA